MAAARHVGADPARSAEDVARELDRCGRTDVEALDWRGLAEGALGDTLRAAGDPAAAEPHLRRARGLASKCWFAQATC